MTNDAPVVQEDSSEARKQTKLATSWGLPRRGMRCDPVSARSTAALSSAASKYFWTIGVSTAAGQ